MALDSLDARHEQSSLDDLIILGTYAHFSTSAKTPTLAHRISHLSTANVTRSRPTSTASRLCSPRSSAGTLFARSTSSSARPPPKVFFASG